MHHWDADIAHLGQRAQRRKRGKNMGISTQTKFLGKCADEKTEVEIITLNGFHMFGRIVSFDQDTISFAMTQGPGAGTECLVYKQGISTIIPNKEPSTK